MTKDAKRIYELLINLAEKNDDAYIGGYISFFPKDLHNSILDIFEELVSDEIISEYNFSTFYEWECHLNISGLNDSLHESLEEWKRRQQKQQEIINRR